MPEGEPMTFDAENGPEMLLEHFQDVEIERWDGPHVHLPDRQAVALYLYGHGLAKADVDEAASKVSTRQLLAFQPRQHKKEPRAQQ